MNALMVTDDVVFSVRSRISDMSIDERSWLTLEGRERKFWFLGKTRTKINDPVEIQYRLLRVGNYKQAWIIKIKCLRISLPEQQITKLKVT